MLKYPLIATRGKVVFPEHTINIDVGRTISLNALKTSKEKFNNELVIVSQKDIKKSNIDNEKDIFSVGTIVRIKKEVNMEGNSKTITLVGIKKIKITKLIISDELMEVEVNPHVEIPIPEASEKKLIDIISKKLEGVIGNVVNIPQKVLSDLAQGISASKLCDILGHYLPIPFEKKQELLETLNLDKRLESLVKSINSLSALNNIDKDIEKSVHKTIDGQQKEYLLRERMKAIKEKLGEISTKDSEIEEWKEKLKDKKYPIEVVEKTLEEIKKYESIPPISSESNVMRSYIDLIINLPWETFLEDNGDIEKAKKILNKHHYALDEVKDRIIEHLAVKINTKSETSPMLTLIGPPGVGKTSLAQSVAEAVGRKMIKISLGGLKDESEIRGHRRTYVGAMPGKIIQAIKKAKTSNPLILLDEIDKMSSDYKGDPTSAMLEVLDPEQNKNFQDHYLELEYDLSKVMFIATANYYGNIPRPLLDRVEMIKLDQYTSEEKLSIAKKHIIPTIKKEFNLSKDQFSLDDETILFIIGKYTMEAGVRGLKRELDKIARKIVVKKLADKNLKVNLNKEEVVKLLGKEKVWKEPLTEKGEIGLVNGMYYSEIGGGVLKIEVTTYPSSKPEIKLTGSIKDVMKESLEIAVGYIKTNKEKYGIDFDFNKNSIHIHVPEGATPKDGPSAGIAFTTALISSLIKKPVPRDIAMTGEITLRGKVLPIGGLKEKTLGAVELGVKRIFIPKVNLRDYDDLAKKVKKHSKIIPVENYDEVFDIIFK